MFSRYPQAGLPTLPVISTGSIDALANQLGVVGTFSSTTFPAINRGLLIPFHIDEPITVTKLLLHNGATVNGNFDMGIYSASYVRLVSSGSTAQSGTNTVQEFDITDTLLSPGDYYWGIASDSNTATVFQTNPGLSQGQANGGLQMASAFPLPATFTPATLSSGFTPFIGLRCKGTVT